VRLSISDWILAKNGKDQAIKSRICFHSRTSVVLKVVITMMSICKTIYIPSCHLLYTVLVVNLSPCIGFSSGAQTDEVQRMLKNPLALLRGPPSF
jgi:hypothetical protein